MFERIVVAYNGSQEAERALLSAIWLAKSVQSELHVLTVTGDAPAYTSYAAAIDSSMPRLLHEDRATFSGALLERARETAHSHGMKLIGHQVEGGETKTILEFLHKQKADLLVIGLHPHDLYISRLWSTVYGLAQDAPCSVLGVH